MPYLPDDPPRWAVPNPDIGYDPPNLYFGFGATLDQIGDYVDKHRLARSDTPIKGDRKVCALFGCAVGNNLADRLGVNLHNIYYMSPLTRRNWDTVFAISSNKLDTLLSETDIKRLSRIILTEFKGSNYGWWLNRSDIRKLEEDYGVVDVSDDEDEPEGTKKNSDSGKVREN